MRSQVKFSIPNSEQDFWNIHKEIAARKVIRHPRIVVCGLTEVGKSTLINAALGKKMVRVLLEHKYKVVKAHFLLDARIKRASARGA